MQIDVVSDTVCPWCFIGKRRLARALEMRPEIAFDVQWRPYQLDSNIPREGVDRASYMKAKFGDGPRVAAMSESLKAEGLREGITFAFEKIDRRPNTIDSHRLIRWAATAGIQETVVERLFAAYFLEGRDIGDTGVLEFLAADAGMDSIEVAALLAEDADRAAVERDVNLVVLFVIICVPMFVFASKDVISSAREAEVLVQVIDKALENEEQISA